MPEELQEKVERLCKRTDQMDKDTEALKHLATELGYKSPGCVFAIIAIRNFRNGEEDSWKLLKFKDNMDDLKDYLCKIGETEFLRDFLEIEYRLKKFPTKKSYCPF